MKPYLPKDKKTISDTVFILTIGIFVLGMSIACFLSSPKEISRSERRYLAQMPALSKETLLDGSFAADFESYSIDQFPLRDSFRQLKALTAYYPLHQLDVNNIYIQNGYVSAFLYPQQDAMLDYAAERITDIYDRYLKNTDTKLYLAVIPDKNCYLTSLHPTIDYDAFEKEMEHRVPFLTPISLKESIQLEDYYKTDTHLKQERLLPVIRQLASSMNVPYAASYEIRPLDTPFYGVYYGQSALPLAPDTICYLTNEALENCTVTSYDTGKARPFSLYDFSKAKSRDPYEFFLGGSVALLTIENKNAATDRELIMFRDSFGSSIAPLLAESYAKITLVDTRYIKPSVLQNFITFDKQDVLFIYSTLLLNDSLALKK